tara:strand:- start:56 stop:391 length:336 start_codon:yes stop_codon:yes gene_type:complete
MGIENLLQMMQQMELLNSFKNDMGYGQLPDFMLEDRSVNQGQTSEDSLFSNQGVDMSHGMSGGSSTSPIQLPESDTPSQENIPVSFSDFFGNPQYNYEQSTMIPKKDEIDD